MKLQVLVSTVSQTDHHLIEKMNISSDAIIINQCGTDSSEVQTDRQGNRIKWFCSSEKGVGCSRNQALMKADSDIVLFADDDVVFLPAYSEIILSEFQKNPRADMIVFNVKSTNSDRPEYEIPQRHRIHFFNCLRYGAFRIAVRLDSIRRERLYFSQLFGGGSPYGSGEDSLFLMDCLRRGLRIYAVPQLIGTVTHEESTWFLGYTEKYFYDKGALFCGISRHFPKLLCLQFCLRHPDMVSGLTFLRALRIMLKGVKDYKKRI